MAYRSDVTDTPPPPSADADREAERFSPAFDVGFAEIKQIALSIGAPGALTIPAGLARIVRLCIDGLKFVEGARKQLQADGADISAMLQSATTRAERAEADNARLRAENAGLREALTDVRGAILQADPAVVTDTIWTVSACPETAIDRIDAALSSEPQVKS